MKVAGEGGGGWDGELGVETGGWVLGHLQLGYIAN